MNHQGAHFRIDQGAHFRIWEGMLAGMWEGMQEGMLQHESSRGSFQDLERDAGAYAGGDATT